MSRSAVSLGLLAAALLALLGTALADSMTSVTAPVAEPASPPRTDEPAPPSSAPPNDEPPAIATAASTLLEPPPASERTQFVLLGMDTTPHGHRRAFEELSAVLNAHRPESEPRVSFTLFIGTGSLQLDEHRTRLRPEELPFQGVLPRNIPVFDYAASVDEIHETAANVRRLDALGVEIGSHTVRHDHGGSWSRERWDFELEDHARILALVGLPAPAGFRAPFLDTNDSMYESLAAHGFTYDCSATQNARRWPSRHPGTEVWVFGVPSVHIPGRDRPVLFYDLNLDRRLRLAAHAAGLTGEAEVASWMEAQYFEAGHAEFMRRYRGGRAPFLVSGHGGFRAGTTRLLRAVCGLPNVRCSTFREAAAYLAAHPELEGAP